MADNFDVVSFLLELGDDSMIDDGCDCDCDCNSFFPPLPLFLSRPNSCILRTFIFISLFFLSIVSWALDMYYFIFTSKKTVGYSDPKSICDGINARS
jgi:hypothetical protein